MLCHPTRRRILTTLVEDPREEFVAADFQRGDDAEQFLLSLRHTHLPRLEEAGYVDWDREANVVRRGPDYDRIAPVVELLGENRAALPGDWP